MTTTPHILMMAAGTGGHVFPALAVAEELAKRGAVIHWLGTLKGMENELVANSGYQFHAIDMQGLRGNGFMRLLKAPTTLLKATLATIKIIQSNRIDAVVGFGGYVTAPGGMASKFCKKPLIIHEQNAIAGMSNRYLSKIADKVLEAFDNTFEPNTKLVTVGNPVREAIIQVPPPNQRILPTDASPLKLLVVGGSLGAKPLNDVIAPTLALLEQDNMAPLFHVRHQCGKNNLDDTQAIYNNVHLQKTHVEIMPFISDMAAAYAWADVIVCRAGALTVTEIANVGLPAIFVPLPHAVDDHQTANAHWLECQQASFLLPQSQLTPESLKSILITLNRQTCLQMANRAKALANPTSSEQVAKIVLQQLGLN